MERNSRTDLTKGYPCTQASGVPSRFERDDEKAKANELKHGVAFAYAALIFPEEDRADVDASRPEDGAPRRKTVGVIEGRLFAIAHTVRAGAIRLMSARRANARESFGHG